MNRVVEWVNTQIALRIEIFADKRALKWRERINEDTAKSFGDLVDIIFAVIIAESFVVFVPTQPALSTAEYFVLALSYMTVIVSWVFYHMSKSNNDYRTPYRFVVDLLILLTYWVLVAYISDPSFIVWAYAVMLWFYMLWGVLKISEYRGYVLRYFFRLPIAIGGTVLAWRYVDLVHLLNPVDHLILNGGTAEAVVVAGAAILVLLFRISVTPSNPLPTVRRVWKSA